MCRPLGDSAYRSIREPSPCIENLDALRYMPLITWLWLIKAGWHRGLGFMHAVNGATRNFQG